MPITHPAWGVGFFGIVGALLCSAVIVFNGVTTGFHARDGATFLFVVLAAAVFAKLSMTAARRWRSWMTHAGVLTGECSLLLLAVTVRSPTLHLEVIWIWVAVFAALYLERRAVALHIVTMMVLLFLATTLGGGLLSAVSVGVTMIPTTVVVAVLTSLLVSRLKDQTERDALTGLLNRRGLHQGSARLRSGADRSVCLLDLDGFKELNDSGGHDAGDEFLVEVSRRWRRELGPADVLARLGGDEFVLVSPAAEDLVEQRTHRLRALLPAELESGFRPRVGLSAGVTAWRAGESLDAALQRADGALYEAKRTGRGRTVRVGPAAGPG